MVPCCECGASIAPDENFCGTCGARQRRDDTPVVPNRLSESDAETVIAKQEAVVEEKSELLDSTLDASETKDDSGVGTGIPK